MMRGLLLFLLSVPLVAQYYPPIGGGGGPVNGSTGNFTGPVTVGTTLPIAPASPCNISVSWASNQKIIMPQSCGAKADGITDDTTAFQAWLNLASASPAQYDFSLGGGTFLIGDVNVPASIDPTVGVKIKGDGATIQFKVGTVNGINFTTSILSSIRDAILLPATGQTCMIYVHGGNMVQLDHLWIGPKTDPGVDNGTNGVCLNAGPGSGNYINSLSNTEIAFLTGYGIYQTDSGTVNRNNANVFTNVWIVGSIVSSVPKGGGIYLQGGADNVFTQVYVQNTAKCLTTALGSGAVQVTDMDLNGIACDSSPAPSIITTGTIGSRMRFNANLKIPYAARYGQNNDIADRYLRTFSPTPTYPLVSFGTLNFYNGGSANTNASLYYHVHAISVTASPFTWANSLGYDVCVDVMGGVVSSIVVNSLTPTACAAPQDATIDATRTDQTFLVPNGQSVVVTYTTTPTMQYYDPQASIILSGNGGTVCLGQGGNTPPPNCISGTNGGAIYWGANELMNSIGEIFAGNTRVGDQSGNILAGGGTTTVYRCATAGALPAGALTITAADCGTTTDTGMRVK